MKKRCTKCGGNGPFGKHRQTKDGLQSWCKECVRINTKKWEDANRNHVREKNRLWHLNNPERSAALARTWHSANLESNRIASRKSKAKHPEASRAHAKTRRARMANVETTLTLEQWREILEYFDYSCAYCLRNDVPMTMDHVVPISCGGGHTAENIIPACKSCNCSKGDKPIFLVAATQSPHSPATMELQ